MPTPGTFPQLIACPRDAELRATYFRNNLAILIVIIFFFISQKWWVFALKSVLKKYIHFQIFIQISLNNKTLPQKNHYKKKTLII